MNEQQEKTYHLKVKLTMLDYFRYYFSLFNLKPSSLIVNVVCGIIILIYSLSLFSLIYIYGNTRVFNWEVGRGMLLDLVIIILFSVPFIRTYLIAFKDAKTHKFLDRYIDITITQDKFIVIHNDTTLEYPWKKMYKIFEFRHGFALFIDNKDLAFVLPKRYFKDKELRELVRTKLFKNDKMLKGKKTLVDVKTMKKDKAKEDKKKK
jgi:hypothetical protein